MRRRPTPFLQAIGSKLARRGIRSLASSMATVVVVECGVDVGVADGGGCVDVVVARGMADDGVIVGVVVYGVRGVTAGVGVVDVG